MIYKEEIIDIDYIGYGLTKPIKKPILRSYITKRTDGHEYYYKKRPAIIICPGGGYSMVADYVEGEPIALGFIASGMSAFVLEYSVAPTRFPAALLELSKTVAYIRENAEKYDIDPDKIFVCGFSAGGHLAASLGVYWNKPFIQDFLGYKNNENKPNGLVLGYPVLSNAKGVIHTGSLNNLFGEDFSQEQFSLFGLENNVTALVPPTFLWHTSDDDCVDVQNSLLFATALRKNNIKFELHIYKTGPHGLGLANNVTASSTSQIIPSCQNWINMATNFIQDL